MLCSRPSFPRKNVTPYLIRGRNPALTPVLWMPDQVRHDEGGAIWLQLIVNCPSHDMKFCPALQSRAGLHYPVSGNCSLSPALSEKGEQKKEGSA